ncbi:uncharacterized protein L201_002133 [Kwoniella dendrophila CBS 6074]|uniref:Uncharacterized protein n=1 Tax=Kwoniella dendrophila CBS 6074 TaxID=1295534 RepID=A0AAX4JRW8_9TREE
MDPEYFEKGDIKPKSKQASQQSQETRSASGFSTTSTTQSYQTATSAASTKASNSAMDGSIVLVNPDDDADDEWVTV